MKKNSQLKIGDLVRFIPPGYEDSWGIITTIDSRGCRHTNYIYEVYWGDSKIAEWHIPQDLRLLS